jgi:ribosomal protein L11 methyltransferase
VNLRLICGLKKELLIWSKLASAKWEDAWVERLSFLGPGRIAIFSLPGSRRIRVEAYALTKREAASVVKTFGGQTRKMKSDAALLAHEAVSPPLMIRNRLIVVRNAKSAKEVTREHPSRPVLVIPAAMAFGTGDHATTSTCLRILCDIAGEREGTRWEALDLGTGTGILAIAARTLGAARCDAWDFDPACIKATRENTRANNLRNIAAARVDVLNWTPSRQWELVTANLFSELLMKVKEKIVASIKPGGRLILSGMLAKQADEALAAFRKTGIRFDRVAKKGKWVTALGTRK